MTAEPKTNFNKTTRITLKAISNVYRVELIFSVKDWNYFQSYSQSVTNIDRLKIKTGLTRKAESMTSENQTLVWFWAEEEKKGRIGGVVELWRDLCITGAVLLWSSYNPFSVLTKCKSHLYVIPQYDHRQPSPGYRLVIGSLCLRATTKTADWDCRGAGSCKFWIKTLERKLYTSNSSLLSFLLQRYQLISSKKFQFFHMFISPQVSDSFRFCMRKIIVSLGEHRVLIIIHKMET